MVDTRLLGKLSTGTAVPHACSLDGSTFHYVSVLLVVGRALDKVQGSGEGEGAAAWRTVHEHWEPRSRSWKAYLYP